jgi:2-methylisocitrate lyase-like PEP mutase family enzyme
MARTDSLIHGYEEALARAKKFIELGVDCIFVEALPNRATMAQLAADLPGFPLMVNIMPGGRTENVPAAELGRIGYAVASYTVALLGARIKAEREVLEELKKAFPTSAAPAPLPFMEITSAVGFQDYYEEEERYKYDGAVTGTNGYHWK